MKFLVTGRSTRIPEVIDVMERIKHLGYKISFDWPALPMVKPYEYNQEKAA